MKEFGVIRTSPLLALAFLQLPVADLNSATAKDKACTDIHDSARCEASSDCHWNVDDVGCEARSLEARKDPCSAHKEKAVCAADEALGCGWKPAQKACASEN